MRVEKDSTVLLNFELSLPGEEPIDSNLAGKPLRYVMGSGDMLPGFEQVLIGMQSGEQKTVDVPAAEAFGQVQEANQQRFLRAKIPGNVSLQVGAVLAFTDATGAEIPGVVTAFDQEHVDVDFNHPLAGRDVRFTVHVHDILGQT